MSASSFTHTTLGRTGLSVHRLGFSASYRPGRAAVHRALDAGMNLFFGFGIDTQLTHPMRDIIRAGGRERVVIATGVYNYVFGYPNIRRTLEKRLRQFGTDVIDLFLFLGVMKEKEFPPAAHEEMLRLRDEKKVRFIGLSTHNRLFAGRLAAEGQMDVLMIRYNAAHRGAEEDIFPHLEAHNPGVISYTATRWTYLLRRPRTWPPASPIPTAGQAYRFVLSNPHAHVCLTAPRSVRELDENLRALKQGPLTGEEMAFMHQFGDAVHHTKRWFM